MNASIFQECAGFQRSSPFSLSFFLSLPYLDNVGHESHSIAKLAHVDVKMRQVVLQGLVSDKLCALADGLKRAQISGGIELRIGRAGHV